MQQMRSEYSGGEEKSLWNVQGFVEVLGIVEESLVGNMNTKNWNAGGYPQRRKDTGITK